KKYPSRTCSNCSATLTTSTTNRSCKNCLILHKLLSKYSTYLLSMNTEPKQLTKFMKRKKCELLQGRNGLIQKKANSPLLLDLGIEPYLSQRMRKLWGTLQITRELLSNALDSVIDSIII